MPRCPARVRCALALPAILVALAVLPATLAAQTALADSTVPTTDTTASGTSGSLWQGITLTEAQRAELRRLSAATQAERQTLLAGRVGTSAALPPELWEQLRASAARHNRAVEALLTAEQRERLAANVAARRQAERTAPRRRAALGGAQAGGAR